MQGTTLGSYPIFVRNEPSSATWAVFYQHSTIGMVLLRRRVGTISLVCRELVILDRALQTAELFNLETLRLRKRSAAASERSHLAARAKASEVLNGSCAVADNYLRQLISAFKNFKR